MADQKIDLSKFSVKSLVIGKKQDIWKSLRYGFIFILFLGLGYLIYRGAEALFPKPQQQTIKVEKGGKATIIQQAEKKRFLIPFIEGGADARSGEDIAAYIRAGIRIEF